MTFFTFRFHVAFFSLLGFLGGVFFWFVPLDFYISDYFYANNKWSGDENQTLVFLYRFGFLPMTLLFFYALFSFIISLVKPSSKIQRARLLAIILTVLVGIGIVVNLLFKQNYNRPRAYQTTNYGGNLQYHHPFQLAETGESFPSGHASGGFALSILFYLFYKNRKKIAYVSLFFAMINGSLLGLARIAQGGHFISDIFFAFIIMQLVNIIIYFKLLNIPKLEQLGEKHLIIKNYLARKAIVLLAVLMSCVLVIFSLFSFPYKSKINQQIKLDQSSKQVHLNITKNDSYVRIYKQQKRDDILIEYSAIGTGLPWSKFAVDKKIIRQENGLKINLIVKRQAYQKEYFATLRIYLPENIKSTSTIIDD